MDCKDLYNILKSHSDNNNLVTISNNDIIEERLVHQRKLSRLLKKLEDDGFISRQITSIGRFGKQRIIKLSK